MDHSTPLSSIIQEDAIEPLRDFFYELNGKSPPRFLREDILSKFNLFKIKCSYGEPELDHLFWFLSRTQEILIHEQYIVVLHRPQIGKHYFYGFQEGSDLVDCLTVQQFIEEREKIAGDFYLPPEKKLVINFNPFHNSETRRHAPQKMGLGLGMMNELILGKSKCDPESWLTYLLEFLKTGFGSEKRPIINRELIKDHTNLSNNLRAGIRHLEDLPADESIKQVEVFLKSLGFGKGFGSTVGRVLETLQMLYELIDSPNPKKLEEFITRVSLISSVAIISPHGWFGQENVLGRPDTGGQVVYILDQVRSLEKYLIKTLNLAGLEEVPKIIVLTRLIPDNEGTTSNQRLEKIFGTENGWILRVPFRDKTMKIISKWISRFEIWPYLEDFAIEGKNQLSLELGVKPDLIIGNYSDGNLVASLISKWTGSIQCNIAHALEKLKYPDSALRWEEMEEEYHFSIQFIADLISMNQADMIVTSTVQEIFGTDSTLGQYESYDFFSMPTLFSVVGGVDLFDPRFNVISPGADETIFFPYTRKEGRFKSRIDKLTHLIFEKKSTNILGKLEKPDKVPIFTIARLDKIKNISGLVESFGRNKELRKLANLIVVAGTLVPENLKTKEEREEIKKMYKLIEDYNLYGNIRWLGIHFSKVDSGEVYRIMADRSGVFVQPALFEAFGLTIVEAMSSGLPVFATRFGGPIEIIKDGENGFLINPKDVELLSQPVLRFIKEAQLDSTLWRRISINGIQRVEEHYSWKLYSEKMIRRASLCRFWNDSDLLWKKKEASEYCNLLFHLIYKERVHKMIEPI